MRVVLRSSLISSTYSYYDSHAAKPTKQFLNAEEPLSTLLPAKSDRRHNMPFNLEIDGDRIIALFSKEYLKPKNKNDQIDVIITVMSNMALENYLCNNLNLKVKRTNVGDINVINTMKKYKSLLGGEQSGHIILSNFSNTGDGILAALKILEILIFEKNKTSKIFDLYKDYSQQKINLKYKRITISAGACGICLATAKICLARGATVYVCDINNSSINKLNKNHLINKKSFT